MKTPSMTKDAISKRNKAFGKLTKPQQRVAIAKDVLAQLNSRNIKAELGTYVWSDKLDRAICSTSEDLQFCELLPKVGTCSVCAKGAIFISALLKADRLRVADVGGSIDNSDIMRYLADKLKIFSRKQLDLIELYFECLGSHPFSYLSDRRRLQEIMQNIVANKGIFNPKQIDEKFKEVE